MNVSSLAPAGTSDLPGSREEVRRRFLALTESRDRGGPPPDLESLLAGFPEPERSELRAELQSLSRSLLSPSDATEELVVAGDATVYPVAAHAPAALATADFAPDATAEFQNGSAPPEPPDATRDLTPGANAATCAPVETAAGGTMDYRPTPPTPPTPPPARKAASSAAAKAARLEVPQSVAGYEILGVLGRGAMGVVYKARQRGLNRLVALKMILSGEHAGAHELARFQAEAEAVAHLHHPNIVQIYEVGEEQGKPFFSLEFVEGTSLDKKASGTPLPPLEAAALMLKLAEAMDYAHKNNIIHRDLKPANVLLTEDGTPKIGDFGLAKRLDQDAGQTRTGTVLGTPSYMAPEQAEGRLQDVGPLSDEYSLGAILYELLTGRPPFKGSTILDTLNQLRTLEPVPPVDFQPGVPRDLETICLKCLQKDPARRYAGAGALAEDLRRFLAGEPIQARPVSRRERLWRWCKRNPRVAGLTAAVVGLLVVGFVGLAAFSMILKHEKDQTEAARIEATKNEKEAREQEAIAKEKTLIAAQNEKRAKETADTAVKQMIGLGGRLDNQLRGRHLSLATAPEVRQLREQVLALLRQALVIVGKKITAAGTTTYGQEAVATELGDLLTQLGQDAEAAQLYRQAHEGMKRLAEAEPDNDQTRANLAVTTMRVGDAALRADGDLRAALDHYTQARDLTRDILEHPRGGQRTPLLSKIALAHDDVRLGQAYLALGQPAAARQCFEEAVRFRLEWCAAEPKSTEAPSWLTQAQEWLGIACSHLGDEKGMRDYLGQALATTEGLVKDHPGDVSYKEDLSEIQGAWGDALLRLDRPGEAQTSYDEALKNLQIVIDSNSDDMSRQPLLALAYERLGAAAARLNKADDAQKHYQEALKLRGELRVIEPRNLSWHVAYALALARAGKAAEADAEAKRVRPRAQKNTELLMQLVRCHAACAAADTAKKAAHTKQALETLQAATDKDYKDSVVLQTDPDLAAVRAEPVFKAILEKVKGR